MDGMMNGKGKYVWTNGIIYEGDFVNNEIIGTGIYRWFYEEYDLKFRQFQFHCILILISCISELF